jgi:hypothetical protein
MKKLLLLPALLACGAAHAQNNALKVDIFRPIINTLALSYEHKLSETSSFQLGVSGMFGFDTGGGGFNGSDNPKVSGFALTPEYRLYLSERYPALEGFYVAPFARYEYQSLSGTRTTFSPIGAPFTTNTEASLNAFGVGVLVGRHWIFKQRFSLDLFLGPGYTGTSVSSDDPNAEVDKGDFVGFIEENNYDIRGGLTFGIAF